MSRRATLHAAARCDEEKGTAGASTSATYNVGGMREILLKRWGNVLESTDLHAQQVQVEPASDGCFLVLLRETGSEFDYWCSSMDEVEHMLANSRIEWPQADDPPR